MQITVKKIKYCLDWFDISDVEIETDDYHDFDIQHRLGSWYLMHFILVDGKRKNDYIHDFQLAEPWEAVIALKSKIRSFNHLHDERDFTCKLALLLNKAQQPA